MNKTYRLIWNAFTGTWVAVAEIARARGKRAAGAVLLAAAGIVLASPALAAPPAPTQLPSGGQVVAGSATISQNAALMTINQATTRAAIDWNTFNVGSQARVNFNQPSSSSVTLNRVLDGNPSQIFGRITANGQVFLTNPNGVYFAPGASVDVGGLVATTHGIGNADFMAGGNRFTRDGASGGVVNDGNLNASLGGYIALLAPEVRNNGVIIAQMGTVALAAGEAFELQFDGNNTLAYLRVEPATIRALVENGNAVQAPGGLIILSAQAVDSLQGGGIINNSGTLEATGLVNDGGRIFLDASDSISHSGIIQADAAANGNGGTVMLIANLATPGSTADISGGISARGGDLGGDGGFVETSGGRVQIGDGARVDTRAPGGMTGTWLIDPVDFTIAASGGNMTGSTLSTNLGGGNVSILSSNGSAGTAGDVNVNDVVAWNANELTLNAQNNININAVLNGSGSASLALQYGQSSAGGGTSTYNVNAAVNLPAGNNFTTQLGTSGAEKSYTVITALGAAADATTAPGTMTLQGMAAAASLAGNYVLGANIDASSTSTWNTGAGFVPIGTLSTRFSGSFDGLGHAISGLAINRPTTDYVGLFGATNSNTVIQNVGMLGGSVIGASRVGALAGRNYYIVRNSYATGSVSGTTYVGGLVGWGANNSGQVSNSYATGAVTGTQYVGGLVGYINAGGTISNSYATGSVSGTTDVGGLLGRNQVSTVSGGYWNSDVNATGIGINNFGTVTGGGGLTSTQMMQMASFSGWDVANTGGSTATWRIYEGHTAPLLRGFLTPLTLADAPDVALTYNGSAQNGASTTTGGVLGAAATGTNAGFYNGYYSTQQGYDITGGNLTIDPAVVTISVSLSGSKVYDGTPTFSTGQLGIGNVVDGDTVSLSAGSADTADKDVGVDKPFVSFTGLALTGASAANYTLTGVSGSGTISAKPVTLSASKTYDGTTSLTGAVTLDTGISGEALTYTGATANAAHVATANKYIDAITLANGSGLASNYALPTLNAANAPASITQRPIAVTAADKTKAYGNADPTLTWSVTSGNLVDGDSFSGVLTRAAGESAGNYGINASALINGNYLITANNGTLTITPLASTPPKTEHRPAPLISGSSAPGQAGLNETGGNVSTGAGGVSVSLQRMPTSNENGIIAVSVPKEMVASGSGFSFPLSERAVEAAKGGDALLTVTTQAGAPLPAWLEFDANTMTFVASRVPDGTLPIQVLVSVGSQQFTIVISERPGA